MRDTNLILTDATVAADAFADSALEINKSGVRGIWLRFDVTANEVTDETLDIIVYGKDADENWAATDTPVAIVPQIDATDATAGDKFQRYVLVMAPFKYICPHYNVTGTSPDFDIECSVVSGPERDVSV